MGGTGSGRWFRLETAKDRVEDCVVLNLFNKLNLEWDKPCTGTFNADNCSMAFQLTDNKLRLMYSVKSTGKSLDYRIPLTRTYPNFGGYRLWFLCPHCNTRCGKLYLAPGQIYYLCRTCANLTYQSTREMSLAKAMRIQDLDDVESIEKMTTSQLINWMKASINLERQIARRK